MTPTLDHAILYGSLKHIVSLYHERARVQRIIFRDNEQSLAEQCYAAAHDLDTSDDSAVLAFVSAWHAKRAEAEDVRGGSGWGRPHGKRKYGTWHRESEYAE